MSTHINPYAPPQAEVADITGDNPEAESIRREHIKHEASIRSVGLFYYFGAALVLVAAVGFIVRMQELPFAYGLAIVYAALGIFSIAVGHELRALKPWARIAAIVLSVIGLFGFPLGTLINGYILYLLLSKKGRRIFEPDYADIVAATPHIKYKTSIVVWILLGILALGIIAAITLPMMMRP